MRTTHDQLDAILNEEETGALSQGGQETADEAAQRLYGAWNSDRDDAIFMMVFLAASRSWEC